MSFIVEYILLILITCIVSVLCVKSLIPLAYTLNVLDVPKTGTRKNHDKATPLLGGVAIFIAMHVVLLFALGACSYFPERIIEFYDTEKMVKLIDGLKTVYYRLSMITLGGLLILLLGLKDDKYGMGPLIKLLVILFVALLLWVLNIRITFFNPMPFFSFLLTFGWILCLTNAFNLLDNMNGLSSGVACVCAFFLLCSAHVLGQYFLAFYAALFIGSVLGFFGVNFNKGGIFLGDNGALFIGYNLAVQTILQSFYISGESSHAAVLLPFFIFLIPVYDTLSVIYIRLKNHKPVYVGDLNHLSHRIFRGGALSKKHAVLWICAMTFISGCTGFIGVAFFELNIIATVLLLFGSFILMYGMECVLKSRHT